MQGGANVCISVCFTPLFFKNDLKMNEVNCGPLLETTSSGNPKEVKEVHNISHLLQCLYHVTATIDRIELRISSCKCQDDLM